jgi:hypothetical protein
VGKLPAVRCCDTPVPTHRMALCHITDSCFHKHIGGNGTPVFRNVLKCLNGYCLVHLLSVYASVDVRTYGHGLVQMCATLFNRPVLRMELLLMVVTTKWNLKRRTLKRDLRVPFCNAN